MENFDHLQHTYAGMTDDELADVASDAYDLTEIAQQVLRAEISRRGLKIELQNSAPKIYGRELTGIRTVYSAEEARKIQDLLYRSGIACFFGRDNADGIDAFHGSFDHGVDLKVDSDDTRIADMLLASAGYDSPDELEDALAEELKDESAQELALEDEENGEEDESQMQFAVHCPKCHSEEIVLDGREAAPGVERERDEKYNWHCDACGYQWQDDGIEEEEKV